MKKEDAIINKSPRDLSLATIHQSNLFARTIRCENRCDRLDEAETTLFYLMASLISENDKEFERITFSPKEISAYLGVNLEGSNNRKAWIKRFEMLPHKFFYFKKPDGSFIKGPFFQMCHYDAKKHLYTCRLNSELTESLLKLKDVGHVISNFGWIWPLKAYAKMIYVVGCSAKNLTRNKLYYDTESLMRLVGSGYSDCRDFVSKVLKPALEEIKAKTNATIIATPIKKGKETVGFVLDCNSKTVAEIEAKKLAPQYPEEYKRFVKNEIYNTSHECINPLNTTKAENVIAAPVQDRDLFDVFSKNELDFVSDKV